MEMNKHSREESGRRYRGEYNPKTYTIDAVEIRCFSECHQVLVLCAMMADPRV